jgi:hypothetical protein
LSRAESRHSFYGKNNRPYKKTACARIDISEFLN